MGKIILVSGSNGSGKSAFAESLVAQIPGKRFYVATMQCRGVENRNRIEKHRRQRAGLDFITMEEPYAVAGLDIPVGSVVLLEDVSNLLANAIFERKQHADSVYQDILSLASICKVFIIVTIGGLSHNGYNGETADYIHALNRINCLLAKDADIVVEMHEGKPVYRKGGSHVDS